MEHREIIEHIVRGMEHYMETLADAPHMEKHSDGICSWIQPKGGMEGPAAVYRADFGGRTEERVKGILQAYLNSAIPKYWCPMPLSPVKNLRGMLVSCGLAEPDAGVSLGMALCPEEYEPARKDTTGSSAVHVRRVTSPEDFRLWTGIVNPVLHECELLDPELYYPLCESGKMAAFLGFWGDVPAAASATMRRDGGGTLEFIATLPDYRKRGLGAAVCRAAIEQLIGEGVSIITLRAREMGVSLYTSLGFQAYFSTADLNGSDIMSCISLIPYDRVNVMKTLEEESIRALGIEKWREIVSGIEVPADSMREEHLSRLMRTFMKRYDEKVPGPVAQAIFCRVKHGLKHGDFAWAREKFLQYRDIDAFCAAMRRETLEGFAKSAREGSQFHGQPVDDGVLRFVMEQPYLLYGAREGKRIVAVAIPCQTQAYLAETDLTKKRYYACHCQLARHSILQDDGSVSSTLCHCSLGHTKVFWEAALDVELPGEVESSVLNGDLLCRFSIPLPDEIIKQYVRA
ncbi:MAG TPA: GNAT family N-acetyltransferase [Clostridia bacterium]|nr:GNAT family N-acetyltransferase [Clostridia bacterium]